MFRSRGLPLLVTGLLVVAAAGIPARADDEKKDEKKKERKTSVEVDVEDGKVKVKMRLRDGRKLERTFEAEEFARRLFGHLPKSDGPEDPDVFEDLGKALESLPDRIERALGGLKDGLEPDKAKDKAMDLEKRVRGTIEKLLESIRPEQEDQVRVQVGEREMMVPARKGKAKLY